MSRSVASFGEHRETRPLPEFPKHPDLPGWSRGGPAENVTGIEGLAWRH